MPEQKKRDRASGSKRPYRMRVRQTAVERTRESIVSAAFALHATIGPSRTTISAIAARAGLQRHTVYAHFPDLDSLYEACTAHGIEAMQMPDPDGWRSIASPRERLDHGLRAMIAWYHTHAPALSILLSDVDPTAPPPATPDPFEIRMRDLQAALTVGWPVDGARSGALDAVIGHAIAFTTWSSLSSGALDDETIASILVGLVEGVATGSIGPDV